MTLNHSKDLTPHKNKPYHIFALVVREKDAIWSQLHWCK